MAYYSQDPSQITMNAYQRNPKRLPSQQQNPVNPMDAYGGPVINPNASNTPAINTSEDLMPYFNYTPGGTNLGGNLMNPTGGGQNPAYGGAVQNPQGMMNPLGGGNTTMEGMQQYLINNLTGSLNNPEGFGALTKKNMTDTAMSQNTTGYQALQKKLEEQMAGMGLQGGGAMLGGMQGLGMGQIGQDNQSIMNIQMQDALQKITNTNDTRNQMISLLNPWYGLQGSQAMASSNVRSAAISADVGHERNSLDFLNTIIQGGGYGLPSGL